MMTGEQQAEEIIRQCAKDDPFWAETEPNGAPFAPGTYQERGVPPLSEAGAWRLLVAIDAELDPEE